MSKPLSKRHLSFIDYYFLCNLNATEAYMRVYNPPGGRNTARANAADLLANPNISEQIEARFSEVHMSADEALKLMADIARGDMAQLMDIGSMGWNLDMNAAKEKGLTKLIKKVKQKTTTYLAKKETEEDREVTELEIELYPADIALERILKVHGKFTDRVDVTSGGEKLTIRILKASDGTADNDQ